MHTTEWSDDLSDFACNSAKYWWSELSVCWTDHSVIEAVKTTLTEASTSV